MRRGGVAELTIPAGCTDSTDWVGGRKDLLEELLVARGAVFLRGLPIRNPRDIAQLADVLIEPRMRSLEHDAAQVTYGEGVYSITDGPAQDTNCLHNTQSHTLEVPGRLLLACLSAPEQGGAILLGHSRRITAGLPSTLLERFRSTGWLLKRTYLDGISVPWQDVLGTPDRTAAENYLRRNHIDHQWHEDGILSTVQRRAAFLTHPVTGEQCWFNNVLYFSHWSTEPDVRTLLAETYGSDRLPFDTGFGDGVELSEQDADTLRTAYLRAQTRHDWSVGDVLLVDNVQMSHGRDSYRGTRHAVVAMGHPVSHQ